MQESRSCTRMYLHYVDIALEINAIPSFVKFSDIRFGFERGEALAFPDELWIHSFCVASNVKRVFAIANLSPDFLCGKRSQKAIIDHDLVEPYSVDTTALNQAVN